MARRSSRRGTSSSRVIRGTDETAYPSSPARPPTINMWLKFGEDFGHLQIHTFCARWAALKSLRVALKDREYGEPDDMGWRETDDGLMRFRLTGDVEGLLDNEDEIEWMPPQPHLNDLLRAAGDQTIKHDTTPDETEKPNRVRKVRKPGVPPPSRDGLVTLADLCAELKIEPRDARKTLRNKVEKPDAGWAWPADEAAKIRAILKR